MFYSNTRISRVGVKGSTSTDLGDIHKHTEETDDRLHVLSEIRTNFNFRFTQELLLIH